MHHFKIPFRHPLRWTRHSLRSSVACSAGCSHRVPVVIERGGEERASCHRSPPHSDVRVAPRTTSSARGAQPLILSAGSEQGPKLALGKRPTARERVLASRSFASSG